MNPSRWLTEQLTGCLVQTARYAVAVGIGVGIFLAVMALAYFGGRP